MKRTRLYGCLFAAALAAALTAGCQSPPESQTSATSESNVAPPQQKGAGPTTEAPAQHDTATATATERPEQPGNPEPTPCPPEYPEEYCGIPEAPDAPKDPSGFIVDSVDPQLAPVVTQITRVTLYQVTIPVSPADCKPKLVGTVGPWEGMNKANDVLGFNPGSVTDAVVANPMDLLPINKNPQVTILASGKYGWDVQPALIPGCFFVEAYRVGVPPLGGYHYSPIVQIDPAGDHVDDLHHCWKGNVWFGLPLAVGGGPDWTSPQLPPACKQ